MVSIVLDSLLPAWHHPALMKAFGNQFSFTRAASGTSGGARKQFPVTEEPAPWLRQGEANALPGCKEAR